MSTTAADPAPRAPHPDDLAFAGLRRQSELVATGDVSSRELVELSLSRIDATRDTLQAFRCVRHEAALAEAEHADRRRAAGERRPLLGVPVAIKDDMDLAGETTAFGCAGSFEPKTVDGELARRFRAAGAVIVGKTNTPEIGQWPFTEGPAFGATRNPWSKAHSPGGSSGGSAAAVAAGLVAGAAGSDGAGSVRIPAAWTHLVGIKPQRGRISTFPDREAFNGLTVIGPLARSVEDAALLLDALAGSHPEDLHRPPAPTRPFAEAARRAPAKLRIALSLKIPFSGAPARLDPRVQLAVERLGDVLARLGHDVDYADPAYGLVGASFMPRSTGGVRDWIARIPDAHELDPRTRHNAKVGRLLSPALGLARRLEHTFQRRLGRIFADHDVVLTPTTAKPPLPIGAIDGLDAWATDKTMIGACPYAWPWNVIGWPAINVPAGFTTDGLPLGAQLLGPASSEPLLLSLAGQLEAHEQWHQRRPRAS
ncbi:MAG TPA: amidase [Solirubrobacteraceae bacterium]|nr:amidase [Solirubrobacteraceae bacterium]